MQERGELSTRRLQDSTLRAGRMTVLKAEDSVDFIKCFDIFEMNLNGTTPRKFLSKWVANRANLSLVVGLYDSCYMCEQLLIKFADPEYTEFANAAVYMLKIFYSVYKPAKVLPVMPHCDNDFETMALKHTMSFGTPMGDNSEFACPFIPDFRDIATQQWDETSKAAGSFLKTLYRFTEVLMGKDLLRVG